MDASSDAPRGPRLRMRVEARVFWPRNLAIAPDPSYCNSAPPAALDTDVAKYHFVYAATAVRQNAQP